MGNKKKTRFIDINYNTLFTIDHGEEVELTYYDGETEIKKVKYIDEYHFALNGNVYHICQFAEMQKANDFTCKPLQKLA